MAHTPTHSPQPTCQQCGSTLTLTAAGSWVLPGFHGHASNVCPGSARLHQPAGIKAVKVNDLKPGMLVQGSLVNMVVTSVQDSDYWSTPVAVTMVHPEDEKLSRTVKFGNGSYVRVVI